MYGCMCIDDRNDVWWIRNLRKVSIGRGVICELFVSPRFPPSPVK